MKKSVILITAVLLSAFSYSCSFIIPSVEIPQNVTAVKTEDGILLKWDDVETSFEFFIYRSFTPNAADYIMIDSTKELFYTDILSDETLPAGTNTLYYYIIAESMFFASSDPSQTVSVSLID